MKTAYAAYKPETMARAALVDAGISFKVSVEVSKHLKGMMSDKAERYLEAVILKKQAVPYTRFTNGVGHRKGAMAAGRYPVKAATHFLALVKLCVANAENKGLGTPLRIVHLAAQEGSKPYHAGRHRGIVAKRTSIDMVMAETEESKRSEKKKAKAQPKAEPVAPAAPVEQPKQSKDEPKTDVKEPESKTEQKPKARSPKSKETKEVTPHGD